MRRLKLKHVMIILLAVVAGACLKSFLPTSKADISNHSIGKTKISLTPVENRPEVAVQKKPSNRVAGKPQHLPQILKKQTQLLALSTESPEEIEFRAHKIVENMSAQELTELLGIAINENKNKDERLAAVFLLMCAKERAQALLENIFFTPTDKLNWNAKPHSAAEADKNFELNLRVMALQGIEKNLLASQKRTSALSSQLTKSNYLNSLMSIVLKGQKIQQPLLQRFIEESLRGANI